MYSSDPDVAHTCDHKLWPQTLSYYWQTDKFSVNLSRWKDDLMYGVCTRKFEPSKESMRLGWHILQKKRSEIRHVTVSLAFAYTAREGIWSNFLCFNRRSMVQVMGIGRTTSEKRCLVGHITCYYWWQKFVNKSFFFSFFLRMKKQVYLNIKNLNIIFLYIKWMEHYFHKFIHEHICIFKLDLSRYQFENSLFIFLFKSFYWKCAEV